MSEKLDRPLLTMVIPTFNRLDCVRFLIESVIHQIPSEGILGETFELLICNNASTDGTTGYLNGLADIKGVRVIHHGVNQGGDANILFCCQAANSKYVWIMGDDDAPLDGAVEAVLECLEHDYPDILYLPSKWLEGDISEFARNKIKSKGVLAFDSMGLALRSSVYVTFISSWIINIDSYNKLAHPPMLDRYKGTCFTQLEWTLTLLKHGRRLMCANDIWLIARGGNSSGYLVFEAFSIQYNRIIDDKLLDKPQLHHFFRRCMLWCFIPGLVWGVRKNIMGDFGGFDKAKTMSILKSAYGNDIFFMLIVVPMIKFNKHLAWCFWLMARTLAKGWRSLYRVRY